MGRIGLIHTECVQRNIGDPSVYFRPYDGASASHIEIGRFKDMGNGVTVVGDVRRVDVVWIDHGAGEIFGGHAGLGNVGQGVAPASGGKHFSVVQPDDA